ncbi:MAG: hypothetical protein JWN23_2833 [Rhodocyclales bacterium]|nr:hypothetical protein [Rhodocyclales bacterium]
MDIKKLQTAVYDRTGIRVDQADPVFALVALNDIVLSELVDNYEQTLQRTHAELEKKFGSLLEIHKSIIAASKELADRADQAHLAAALKAAAEAKKEIMRAAQEAGSSEITKIAAVVANAAHQLALAGQQVKANGSRSWAIAIVQAVIGGIVASTILVTAQHFN